MEGFSVVRGPVGWSAAEFPRSWWVVFAGAGLEDDVMVRWNGWWLHEGDGFVSRGRTESKW